VTLTRNKYGKKQEYGKYLRNSEQFNHGLPIKKYSIKNENGIFHLK
jgi:hypothetical protein